MIIFAIKQKMLQHILLLSKKHFVPDLFDASSSLMLEKIKSSKNPLHNLAEIPLQPRLGTVPGLICGYSANASSAL